MNLEKPKTLKFKCEKCNDCTCFCEREPDEDGAAPPGIVTRNICLVAPRMFADAEWVQIE